MAASFIEHVNISVGSPNRTAAMLARLFDWQVRWSGLSALGGRTLHVGGTRDYVAVHGHDRDHGAPLSHAKGQPLNHIGVQVEDLDEVEARAIDLGLKPFNHGNYDPGRRFYFMDLDGIEWEIVSYASAAPAAS